MSDDWKSWMSYPDATARDGLIRMLGVCVDDCEVMAKAGREALAALTKPKSARGDELNSKVADAVATMDNYRMFPLEALQGAAAEWQEAAAAKITQPAPLEEPMDEETMTTDVSTTTSSLHYEDLGEAATPSDLVPFYDRFAAAADNDPRVESYGCDSITNRRGEVVSYRITLTGTVTVVDFVNEVFECKHGSW